MTMRKLGLYFTGACIALLALLAVVRLTPSSPVKADGGSIVGTWILTVTVNTPPGAPPFVETELTAINPGGTFTLTGTAFNAHSSENPFLPPPLAADFSDGYGTWKQTGDDSNQFALTFKRLIFAGANTPTAAYGSFFPGENVGVATIEAVATLQTSAAGQTLTGPFTFQLRNLQGTQVFAGSGTFAATRLKIEPLM
jgi:hypothetical protein